MRSSEATESHELSVEIGTEFSQEFESETKIGEPENEQSFKASFGFEQSISTGTTNSWENTQTAEQESRTVQELESSRETEVGPGTCVQATMLLRNTSTVGFKLSNLAIIATTPDPEDPTRSRTLATMEPVSGEPKAPGECPGTQQGATVELDTNTAATPITFAGPGDEGAGRGLLRRPEADHASSCRTRRSTSRAASPTPRSSRTSTTRTSR